MAIEFVYPGPPTLVADIRPIVLVKARGFFQFCFGLIDDEYSFGGDHGQGLPGNGKQLVAEPHKTAKFKDCIRDPARVDVDDQIINGSDGFTLEIYHPGINNFINAKGVDMLALRHAGGNALFNGFVLFCAKTPADGKSITIVKSVIIR